MLKMELQMFAEKPKKNKNAKRKHYIAEWTSDDQEEKDYKWLAVGITSISDDTEEQTEDGGDYSGDGTVTTEITGISEKWTVEGSLLNDDPAQQIIASKEYELGDGRKVWHKIVRTNGEIYEAPATISDLKAKGGGEFSEFEPFSCALNFTKIPENIGTETP